MSLFGCSGSYLHVQNDYFTYEDLASKHVGSPDPRKNGLWFGQHLIVQWSVPKECMSKPRLRIELTLRYRNREQLIKNLPLKKRRGTYIYKLMNDDFFEKKGILTYQVKILSGESEVLDTWTHKLWTNLLEIEPVEFDFSDDL